MRAYNTLPGYLRNELAHENLMSVVLETGQEFSQRQFSSNQCTVHIEPMTNALTKVIVSPLGWALDYILVVLIKF